MRGIRDRIINKLRKERDEANAELMYVQQILSFIARYPENPTHGKLYGYYRKMRALAKRGLE